MTNITFAVDNDIYKRMKMHPEIKWSEILRRAIIQYLDQIENYNSMPAYTLKNRLSKELIDKINQETIKESEEYYQIIKKSEKKRRLNLIIEEEK